MSEPKTKPTDANVYEFLESASTPRRREEGLELVELFRDVTGAEPVMWGPTMVGYGTVRYILSGGAGGTAFKTGFSPRKGALTFYGLNTTPEAKELLPELGKFKEGVSCVYANNLEDIDLKVLRRLIELAWAQKLPEPVAP